MGRVLRLMALALVASPAPSLFAQVSPFNWERMAEYLGLPLPAPVRDSLGRLGLVVEDASRPAAERVEAGRRIGYRLLRAAALDSARNSRYVDILAARLVAAGRSLGPEPPSGTTPAGHLPPIVKRGREPVTLILIPDYRKEWLIWQRFMDANADRFTMYTFSLPGYGGTPPYLIPGRARYADRVWLESVAEGVIRLIETEKLRRPILVGALNGGTYVAVRAAARRSDQVAGIVSLNGALYDDELPSRAAAASPLNDSLRGELVARSPTAILSPVFAWAALKPDSAAMLSRRPIAPSHPITFYTRDTTWVREILRMHFGFAPVLERYHLEWQTADLRELLVTLPVPVLAIPSVYDQDSMAKDDRSILSQWDSLARQAPRARLTVKPLENVRAVSAIDAPERIGALIAEFAGRQR